MQLSIMVPKYWKGQGLIDSRGTGEYLFEHGFVFGEQLRRQGFEQLVLAGKIIEEGHAADLRSFRNVLDRGRFVALFLEQAFGGGNNSPASFTLFSRP